MVSTVVRQDYRTIHVTSEHVLVFSVKDQSLLVLSKYSITGGQLANSVSGHLLV